VSEVTKQLISIKLSKIPLGLYDKHNNLIEKFSNQVEARSEANKFKVDKSTISKYVKTGKLFKNKYYIIKINN